MSINLTSRGEGDLCTRYRPHTFDEVVGQYTTTASIRKAVSSKNSSKCYLFYGESGCGKSTLAFIMALALNCSKLTKKGNPCCKCKNCLNVMSGSLIDYKEINAAEASGINEIRAIIEDLKLKPMFGKVKIYVLNEAHGMTAKAQDALLHDMDHMPEGAYIILTSTEAPKIRKPLRFRCESYEFRKLVKDKTRNIIDHVLALEGEVVSSKIRDLILSKSENRPRNVLKLLQTALNIGINDEKSLIEAIETDNAEDNSIADLCRAVQYKKTWPEIMKIYKDLNLTTESIYYIMGSWFKRILESSKDRSQMEKNYKALSFFVGDLPNVRPENALMLSICGVYKVYNG